MAQTKLTIPKYCPSDHFLLVSLASKFSKKNIDIQIGENIKLVDDKRTLYQSVAIANHLLADSNLLANKELDKKDYKTVQNQINEHVSIALNLISPNSALTTFPIFNATKPSNKDQISKSNILLDQIKKDLNNHLALNTYLVAERLTLADLALASSLNLLYKTKNVDILDNNFRNLNRWFKMMQNSQNFINSQGIIPSDQKFDFEKFEKFQKMMLTVSIAGKVSNIDAKGDNNKNVEMDPKKLEKKRKKELAKLEKQKKFEEKQKKKVGEKVKNKGGQNKKSEDVSKPKVVTYDIEQEYGEKKCITNEWPNAYSPKYVEAQWYSWWEKSGFFKPEYNRPNMYTDNNETFMIAIPPPNVTGSLHLGHAVTTAIEDSLVRWHRMQGKTTLWNPGVDHAGIATQVVVEKKLRKEQNVSRHDLGRENFLKHVWEWKNKFGNRIYDQLKCVGASCDWDRACFTMDPKLVTAVQEAFIRLHDKGTIFRANRLVHWSTQLRSAISTLEVDNKTIEGRTMINIPGYNEPVEFGVLIYFSYKIKNSNDILTVATTRIETMLGDTAIAVHSEDDRFKHLIGQQAIHPFCQDRIIPIVGDTMVDREFGTGAVKITPAHDHNDFEVGKRHNLEFITIFTDDGLVKNTNTVYDGMKRFTVRKQIVQDLDKLGLYVETKDNPMAIPMCSRSKDVVEPLIKAQWFVNTDNMAKRSCDAVKNGDLKILPKTFEKNWFYWLEHPQDWCISRQLWWGHRIPAYFVNIEGKEELKGDRSFEGKYWVTGRNIEEAKVNAQKAFPGEKFVLEQDEDVLDTWFSSALFPFSIFGWPNETPDLKKFFPGSLLETGHDILFFWVARMVMFSLEFTDQLPFKEVFLHAMVRDAHGVKMSKSIGNVIDPIWVIEGKTLDYMQNELKSGNIDSKNLPKALAGQKSDYPEGIPECGADAMRFALCAYTSQDRNINLDVKRVVGYRNFCNKLWNATKFAMRNLEGYKPVEKEAACLKREHFEKLSNLDKWILSRLSATIKKVQTGFEEYQFQDVTTACYSFWLYDLCDVYVEGIKPVIYGKNVSPDQVLATKETLCTCLDVGLKLLAPIMPFISEELWQRLPKSGFEDVSIHVSKFPKPSEWDHLNNLNNIEKELDFSMNAIKAIRSIRGDYNLKNKDLVDVYIKCSDGIESLEKFDILIKTLSTAKSLNYVTEFPNAAAIGVVNKQCEVAIDLTGIIDIKKEIEKLNKQKIELTKKVASLETKINKESYKQKVPLAVQEKDVEKLNAAKLELKKVDGAIVGFSK